MKYEKSLTPQDVILNAYTYFEAECIDEESLTRVALQANCPSAEVAQGVFANMVSNGLIEKRIQDNKTIYCLPV